MIVAALLLLYIGYDFRRCPQKGHAFLPRYCISLPVYTGSVGRISTRARSDGVIFTCSAALAYFSNTTKHPSRNRFQHFLSSSVCFFSPLLNQFLPGRQLETDKISLLWIFRFWVSAILSGLMLPAFILPAIVCVGLPVIKTNYYDALFQSNQDAFIIIYNQENHEVVDCKQTVIDDA